MKNITDFRKTVNPVWIRAWTKMKVDFKRL